MKTFEYTTKDNYIIKTSQVWEEVGDVENGPKVDGPYLQLEVTDPDGKNILDPADDYHVGNSSIHAAKVGLQIVNEHRNGDTDSLEDLLYRLYWGV